MGGSRIAAGWKARAPRGALRGYEVQSTHHVRGILSSIRWRRGPGENSPKVPSRFESLNRMSAPSDRGCVEDQPQHFRMAGALRLVEDDTAAVRFRERRHVVGWPLSSILSPLLRRGARKKSGPPNPGRSCAISNDCSMNCRLYRPGEADSRRGRADVSRLLGVLDDLRVRQSRLLVEESKAWESERQRRAGE
jgi:hypothetical protein